MLMAVLAVMVVLGLRGWMPRWPGRPVVPAAMVVTAARVVLVVPGVMRVVVAAGWGAGPESTVPVAMVVVVATAVPAVMVVTAPTVI